MILGSSSQARGAPCGDELSMDGWRKGLVDDGKPQAPCTEATLSIIFLIVLILSTHDTRFFGDFIALLAPGCALLH